MKTLIRHRNQILFGLLIVVLGFSKSWFMTATPLIHVDMASDQDATSTDDTTTKPDPKKHDPDGLTAQRKQSLDGTTHEAQTPSKQVVAAAQQKEAQCMKAAGTDANKKKVCGEARAKAVRDAKVAAGAHGAGAKAAAVTHKAEADDVQGPPHDSSPHFDAKTEALLNSMDGIPYSKKFNVTQDGVTTTYQIQAVQGVPTQGQTLVDGQLQTTNGTTLVASIRCITCDSDETLTSNAKNVGDFLKDIANQMADKGSDYAKAKKADKKRENDIKNCKRDEDGNKLGDEDQMICEVKRDEENADRGDRVDTLREDAEDDILGMIQEGPNGAKKARKYIRDLKAEMPGDSDTREYLTKLSKFATDYGRVAGLAKQSSLACQQASQQCMMQKQMIGNQIAQIEQPYAYNSGHSWGTQDYLNDFSQILLNYGQQATINPFGAYNSFYNNTGVNLLGNNGLSNGLGGLGNNGLGINSMNGPAGFQVTGVGPNGMTGAPAGYTGYNGINNSLLNSSAFNMRQATRTGPGYTLGGTNTPVFN